MHSLGGGQTLHLEGTPVSCPTQVLQASKEVWKQHKTLENPGVADGGMKAAGGEKGAEICLVSFSLRGHPPREEPGRASTWAEHRTSLDWEIDALAGFCGDFQ